MTKPYEQWVWIDKEADGKEGMIVASIPILGPGAFPLAHRREDVARDQFGPLAVLHGERTGHPVRLVRMVEVKETT